MDLILIGILCLILIFDIIDMSLELDLSIYNIAICLFLAYYASIAFIFRGIINLIGSKYE